MSSLLIYCGGGYNRIIKDNGAIILFGSEPFSSKYGSNNKMIYNPQGLIELNKIVCGIKECKADSAEGGHKFARKSHKKEYIQRFTNYPNQLLYFNNEGKTIHPTQNQ